LLLDPRELMKRARISKRTGMLLNKWYPGYRRVNLKDKKEKR